jgi:hypothetical protein
MVTLTALRSFSNCVVSLSAVLPLTVRWSASSRFSWRPNHFSDWLSSSNELPLLLYSANRKLSIDRTQLSSCIEVGLPILSVVTNLITDSIIMVHGWQFQSRSPSYGTVWIQSAVLLRTEFLPVPYKLHLYLSTVLYCTNVLKLLIFVVYL